MNRPARLTIAALLVALATVASGCGVPPTEPPSAQASSASASPAAASGTLAADPTTEALDPGLTGAPDSPTTASPPVVTPSSSPPSLQPEPAQGIGEWPPTLLLTDLKEAGNVELVVAGVRFQLPAGSAALTVATDRSASYELTSPGVAATGTVRVDAAPASGSTATTMLAADGGAAVTRVGDIQIPGLDSAAIGEAVDGGDEIWILGLVTPGGDYVRAEFQAPADAFDDLLIYQSVASVKWTG